METARERTILIHYSEIGLKRRNQATFRNQLRNNLRTQLRSQGMNWPVQISPGFFATPVPSEASDAQVQAALGLINDVFGVSWCALTEPLRHEGFRGSSQGRDLETLENAMVGLANATGGKTFCVRVRRSDKMVPFTSMELEQRLGQVLRERTHWQHVNLKTPEVVFHAEIRPEGTFVFSNRLKGAGGLPVGTAGRVLTLLSGGIDSPVAAYLMAKRGCRVDYLHFSATPMQKDEAKAYKVWRLVQRLNRFTLGGRLFLVPYTYYDVSALAALESADYELVIFRRFMARVGEALAKKIGAQALVTGDNLAQVASQTLPNLVSTSRAIQTPIFRPLISFDKEEIVDLAVKIGTYETSIEPYKDCCAIIGRHPRTKSNPNYLQKVEDHLFPKYAQMIEQTLAEAVMYEFKPGE